MTAAQPVGDEATTLTEDEREALSVRAEMASCGNCGCHVSHHHLVGGCETTFYGPPEDGFPSSACTCTWDFSNVTADALAAAVERILTARLAAVRVDRGAADQQAGTTVTEWGVQDVASGDVAADSTTTQDGGRFQAAYIVDGIDDGCAPERLVTRQRTTYPDRVTEWTAAAVVDARGETGGGES